VLMLSNKLFLKTYPVSCKGGFNPIIVRQKRKGRISGGKNLEYQLWSVIIFQSLLEGGEK
jgi:hypothetical protein